MAEEVKYFKQVKCPDCTWSQYQDSEPCAMTPCDRCNSTGYIFEPVDVIENPIWDFSIEDETITTELKGEGIAQETSEYDPQAVEFGWFIEHGWLTPEEARMKDAECQERVERIKGEIERKSWNTPYISIDEQLAGKEPVVYREVKMEEAQWQSLWDKELK